MIRVCIFSTNLPSEVFGYDTTGWEDEQYSKYYDNLLTEDLVERLRDDQIVMYFSDEEDAEDFFSSLDVKFTLLIKE